MWRSLPKILLRHKSSYLQKKDLSIKIIHTMSAFHIVLQFELLLPPHSPSNCLKFEKQSHLDYWPSEALEPGMT